MFLFTLTDDLKRAKPLLVSNEPGTVGFDVSGSIALCIASHKSPDPLLDGTLHCYVSLSRILVYLVEEHPVTHGRFL